jgi:hypothetical protein
VIFSIIHVASNLLVYFLQLTNRAASYLRRQWLTNSHTGSADAQEALMDASDACRFHPQYGKAWLRLSQALHQLKLIGTPPLYMIFNVVIFVPVERYQLYVFLSDEAKAIVNASLKKFPELKSEFGTLQSALNPLPSHQLAQCMVSDFIKIFKLRCCNLFRLLGEF